MVTCPICGKGKIANPKDERLLRIEMTKTLLKAGFGIRQTQRFIGWGSPRSVSIIKEEMKRSAKIQTNK